MSLDAILRLGRPSLCRLKFSKRVTGRDDPSESPARTSSGNRRGLEARRDADLGSQQHLLSGRCFPTEGEARLNTA
eukprot:1087045-Rhodomonas_salina.1